MKRRSFFAWGILGTIIGPLALFNRSSRSYVLDVHLHHPGVASNSELFQVSNDWLQWGQIAKIQSHYQSVGAILDVETMHLKQATRWKIRFRNRKSFLVWMSHQKLRSNPVIRKLGVDSYDVSGKTWTYAARVYPVT